MGPYGIRIGAIWSNYRMGKVSWFDFLTGSGDVTQVCGDQLLGRSRLTRSASQVRGQVRQVSSGRTV
jgi:hypothetical protein